MNKSLKPEIREIIEAVHYRPSISLIMPFKANISLEIEFEQSFKIATDKIERDLKNNYPLEIAELMMLKLKTAVEKVNPKVLKKGVAIYISPIFEKIVYLDVPVRERIVIDESFEIRDLIYSKKQFTRYLLLLLSAKQYSLYLGNLNQFVKIEANIPESIDAYKNDWPEKVANFTDSADRKQVVIHKFLQHIDADLGRVIHEHQLPVFAMGAKKILGHFKKISKHQDAIAGYISGNYNKLGFSKLEEVLKSHLELWRTEKDKATIKTLDVAEGKNKLIKGIKPVWEAVMNNLGNKIFVESDFMFSAQRGAKPDLIEELQAPYNEFSYIRDAVDDLIEKAIVNGGDVDFMQPDSLKNYERIALVTY